MTVEGRVLLAMCGLLFANGLLGALIQYALPRTLLGIIEREVRVEDVEARRREIFVKAEERILGGSEPLVVTGTDFVVRQVDRIVPA